MKVAFPGVQDRAQKDRGAVLILVLAVAIGLSLVVLALTNFVAADLRYARVVDGQAKRLASAQSGIDYALDRLRLNQTLCGTKAASISAVSLNGANVGAVGTPLPQPINGTTTKVTCKRLNGAIADVAGWAVVITNFGEAPPNDQIQIDTGSADTTATISGPVFLPDPSRTDTDDDHRVEIVDGDLWYTRSNCSAPFTSVDLADNENIDVAPREARGGICSTRLSGSSFSDPPMPAMPLALPAPPIGINNPDDVTYPGCRVFYPGRYDAVPDLAGATNVYFRSGDYLFNYDTEWLITGDNVWAGYRGSPGGLGVCDDAAANDAAGAFPQGGGRPGATFYFDRDSHIWLETDARLEIFPRRQGNYTVSVHALATSSTTTDPGYQSLLRTMPSSEADLVVHGLVWAPRGRINIDNGEPGSDQRLLGGVVVRILWLRHVDPDFEIRPAKNAIKTTILLTSTSATVDGGSTTVEAVVDYRPDAVNLADRVAVNSSRVVG